MRNYAFDCVEGGRTRHVGTPSLFGTLSEARLAAMRQLADLVFEAAAEGRYSDVSLRIRDDFGSVGELCFVFKHAPENAETCERAVQCVARSKSPEPI